MDDLRKRLSDAVNLEDYETAAVLRDEIRAAATDGTAIEDN